MENKNIKILFSITTVFLDVKMANLDPNEAFSPMVTGDSLNMGS